MPPRALIERSRSRATLRARVRGTAATAPGAAPATFELTAATAADRAIYDAPSSPWRIARRAGRAGGRGLV
jgi:hypothetical protein